MKKNAELIFSLKKFGEKDLTKAKWQIVTSFGPYLLLFALSYWVWDSAKILAVDLMLLNAFFLVRIFIIQHDAGHNSFFDPRSQGRWNRVMGWVGSVFSTLPYTYWATIHHHHHVHTGKLEIRDIGDINFWTVDEYRCATPFKKAAYRIFRHPLMLFVVVPIFYFLFANRNPMTYSFNEMTKKVRWSQVVNNLLIIGVYSICTILFGWTFLIIQGITVFFFSVIAFWFFYVQHSHEKTYQKWMKKDEWEFVPAALEGASRYDIHPVFHWLTGNIGYHHLHHLNPAIPSYRLQEADAATFPQLVGQINNLSFTESLSCIHNKLWDEEEGRYISFREFNRREKC
jgi:omega-6 fatty acid desaturase (delta-12 desaturase)